MVLPLLMAGGVILAETVTAVEVAAALETAATLVGAAIVASKVAPVVVKAAQNIAVNQQEKTKSSVDKCKPGSDCDPCQAEQLKFIEANKRVKEAQEDVSKFYNIKNTLARNPTLRSYGHERSDNPALNAAEVNWKDAFDKWLEERKSLEAAKNALSVCRKKTDLEKKNGSTSDASAPAKNQQSNQPKGNSAAKRPTSPPPQPKSKSIADELAEFANSPGSKLGTRK